MPSSGGRRIRTCSARLLRVLHITRGHFSVAREFLDCETMIKMMEGTELGCSPTVEECVSRGYFHDEADEAIGQQLLQEINELTWGSGDSDNDY